MEIPKKIKAGVMVYEVVYDDTMDDLVGETISDSLIVKISSKLPPKAQEETFLHELLHVASRMAGINDKEKLDEEAFISRISPSLFTLLEENL